MLGDRVKMPVTSAGSTAYRGSDMMWVVVKGLTSPNPGAQCIGPIWDRGCMRPRGAPNNCNKHYYC